MSSIVISTGGTGGHVIPAKVFYDYFKKKLNVKLISDKRGLNFIDIKNYNVNEIHIPQFKKNLNIVIFPFFFYFFIFKIFIFFKKRKSESSTVNRRLYEYSALSCSKDFEYQNIPF